MIEVRGKYNSAKIFTDVVDETSIAQVVELCSQEFIAGSRVRMMPDIHAGAGCTVGTTLLVGKQIVPNLVGVDIGCGMLCVKLKNTDIDLGNLDNVIRTKVPSGFNIRSTAHNFVKKTRLNELRCIKHINMERAILSVGTLGGGNHFIEVDKDTDGALYLIIHSGSRHLGIEVCNYYQELGYNKLNNAGADEIKALVDRLKSEGKQQQIEAAIKTLKSTKRTNIPKALAYVEGQDFDDYLHDMEIVQEFAELNRKAMASVILEYAQLNPDAQFTTIHNYIDTKNMILRKGAVSAQKGEQLLIPINMRDGSLLCVGKGNEDWNYSAPHGAGRLMSRSAAKQEFTVTEFEEQMKGIYTTCVGQDTLDECPMTYKKMADIVNNITDTAEIKAILKPIYNFKATE